MGRATDNLARVREIAAALLRSADADERLPTPVDDLISAAGLVETGEYVLSESRIRQAPRELRQLLRAAGRKVRGILDRRERIVHVNPDLHVQAQRQFVRCHETMHDLLPWQRDLLILGDTSKTLSAEIEFMFEREANQGAAELLFQIDLLRRIARDYRTDIATPIELAQMFGASIHSTFRRWIESHRADACGLVLDPKPVSEVPLVFRRFELIESAGWRQHMGIRRFPKLLRATDYPFLSRVHSPAVGAQEDSLDLVDARGSAVDLRVQWFNNHYRMFVLLFRPVGEGFVARHRKSPRLRLD